MSSIIQAKCDVCHAVSEPFDPEDIEYPPGWWVVTVTTDRVRTSKRVRAAMQGFDNYLAQLGHFMDPNMRNGMVALRNAVAANDEKPVVVAFDMCARCRGKHEAVFAPVYAANAREVKKAPEVTGDNE